MEQKYLSHCVKGNETQVAEKKKDCQQLVLKIKHAPASPQWPKCERLIVTSIDKDGKQKELIAGRNASWYKPFGKQLTLSIQAEHMKSLRLSKSTTEFLRNKNSCIGSQKDIYANSNSSHKIPQLETTQMLIH